MCCAATYCLRNCGFIVVNNAGAGYSPGVDHLASILLHGLLSSLVFGHQFSACRGTNKNHHHCNSYLLLFVWYLPLCLAPGALYLVPAALYLVPAALCLVPAALCLVFTRAKAFQICHALCPSCLQGDSENYYDPSNSLLPFVLATRRASPSVLPLCMLQ